MTEQTQPVEQAAAAPATGAAAVEWLRERAWIAGWWLVGRAAVFVTAFVVGKVGPRGYIGHDERTHVFGLLVSWDGHWYKRVAEHGYLLPPGRQADPAFFPLYPMLLRAVHAVGLSWTAAETVVPNLLLLVALAAFHALTRALLGDELARRATVYAAIFPISYVFSMSYPESLVLASMSFAALAALRGRWGQVAFWGAVGALARPEGAFVALPLLALAWRERSASPHRRGLALGAAVAPVAALAAYPLYLWTALGDPFAYGKAQSQWQRHFSPLGLLHSFEHLPHAFGQSAWIVRDLGALFLYLLLLALALRAGAPLAWILAGLVVVVLPPFSGSFASIARFGLLVPPVFWGLAKAGGGRRADRAIRVLSVALLVAATATVPLSYP
ncbi:MAG TPA: hypothetical protein VFJ91_11810 [Gaiellaceae bacterium]|nr:hypothetical protein [Gaiellaceae bacterium]